MTAREWTRDGDEFVISTDPTRLDLDVVHGFLRCAYWSPDVPRELVVRAIRHSIPFGLYGPAGQAGFARVVTDHATFAWLADVFVLEPFRGRGLGTWLTEVATGLPELAGLRRWLLATGDAHGLYRRFGFTDPPPALFLERTDFETYRQAR